MTFTRMLARSAVPLLIAAAMMTTPAWAENMEVKIDNFSFSPEQLTVKAGTTVTWINHDDIPHNIVSKTKLFKSNALDTEDKFSFTFTTPGSYTYFCALHPHMVGSIVVEADVGG